MRKFTYNANTRAFSVEDRSFAMSKGLAFKSALSDLSRIYELILNYPLNYKDLIKEALSDVGEFLGPDVYEILYDSITSINDLSQLNISSEFTKAINVVKKTAESQIYSLTKYHKYIGSYLRLVLIFDKLTELIPDTDLDDIRDLRFRSKEHRMFNADQLVLVFRNKVSDYNWIDKLTTELKTRADIETVDDTLIIRLK